MKTDAHDKMEELLNAYHDGQLNAREAAKVERLLENDAHAKLLLDQIVQTSQLVRQLPRAEAPESLRDEIQYQLERDQLLNPQADEFQRIGRIHLRLRRLTAAALISSPNLRNGSVSPASPDLNLSAASVTSMFITEAKSATRVVNSFIVATTSPSFSAAI